MMSPRTTSHALAIGIALGTAMLMAACSGGSGSSQGASTAPLPAASASYFLPYQIGYSTAGNGLYVARSSDPSGTPQLVVSGEINLASKYVEQALTDGSGNIYQTIPSTAFFTVAPPPYDNDPSQLFKMDLTHTTQIPAPVQIGSLSYQSQDYECSLAAAERSANDPGSTLILDWRSGADGQCFTADDTILASQASDDATTAQRVTPIAAPQEIAQIQEQSASIRYFCCNTAVPVYDAGSLGMTGIVYRDSSNDLVFADPDFTSPSTLLTGITVFSVINSEPGYLFVIAGTANAAALYRINANGTISQDLYDFQLAGLPQDYFSSPAVADLANGNLWFSDNGATFSGGYLYAGNETSYEVRLLRVALSGQQRAQQIYSTGGSLPASFANTFYALESRYAGSRLAFTLEPSGLSYDYQQDLYTNEAPALVYTLPLDAAAGSQPQEIANVNGYINIDCAEDDQLFGTVYSIDSTGHLTGIGVKVLDLDGSTVKDIGNASIIGHSTQLRGTVSDPQYSYPLIYVAENPTASLPDLGGATLYTLATADMSQTAVTQPDGTPYVLQDEEYDHLFEDPTNLIPMSVLSNPTVVSGVSGSVQNFVVLDTANNRLITVANNPNDGTLQPFSNVWPSFGTGTLF